MLRRLSLLSLLLAMPLIGCGAPREGDGCSSAGFLCLDATAALECRDSKWSKLPCRGPAGCKREGDIVRCDMSQNLENDACASTAEGRGLCTQDQKNTLECRQGTLVKTKSCRSCVVNGDQVICSP